jgi:hypothetical protein
MVDIDQIKNICDDLDGNCGACPFGAKDGCPFLSNDPFDWDTEYINKRYQNFIYNKENPMRKANTGDT